MRITTLIRIALVATAAAGSLIAPASIHGDTRAEFMTARAPSRQPLLAVVQPAGNLPSVLVRLNPLSLKPVSRAVPVAEYHHAWSISPDGSRVALGRGGQGIGIEIVDLRAMKLVRNIQTGIAAEALAWLTPRRLVAALQRGGTVTIDPDTGRILHRWPGFSFPDASALTSNGLVMLLPRLRPSSPNLPLVRVAGPPRLAVVDVQGRLRAVTLGRIHLDVRFRGGIMYADRAGLAVDVTQDRAFVFAADAPVAEIDLRKMRVSYHVLKPFFWPPARSPGRSGESAVIARERSTVSFGSDGVVVDGRDFIATGGADPALAPAGALLVNTSTWTWRLLSRDATGAAFAGGRLLTYSPGSYSAAGTGVRTYTRAGRPIAHLFRAKHVLDVYASADLAYVRTPAVVYAIDVTSGKVTRKITPPPDVLDLIARRS